MLKHFRLFSRFLQRNNNYLSLSYINNNNRSISYTKIRLNNNNNNNNTNEIKIIKQLTPGMRQYMKVKESVPGYILFFQMGDFFELFYEDAILVSKLLDLTLTSRTKSENSVPMCGIPLHTIETYIGKLIHKGQMVAVCEQINDDKPSLKGKRRSKATLNKVISGAGVVKREITRLVSPGTLIEDHLLQPRLNNYIASIYYNSNNESTNNNNNNGIGLAWMDVSTSNFHYTTVPSPQELKSELFRINPSEIICSYNVKALLEYNSYSILNDALENASFDKYLQECIKNISKSKINGIDIAISDCLNSYRITPRLEKEFEYSEAYNTITNSYSNNELHHFSIMNNDEICAIGSLLKYISQTQKNIPSLSLPQKHIIDSIMHIDAATFQCLELVESNNASNTSKTLLNTIDYTVTGPGARLLASRLVSPLINPTLINERLDCVEFFVNNEFITESLRILLKQCFDMERSLQRISLGKCGPRDLSSISNTIGLLSDICNQIKIGIQSHYNPIIESQCKQLDELSNKLNNLYVLLSSALVDNPPLSLYHGGFIKKGYCKELDDIQILQLESKDIIGRLQNKYKVILGGITGLKIKSNQVLGMHIEVPSSYHKTITDFNSKIQSSIKTSTNNSSNLNTLNLDDILSDKIDYKNIFIHCQTMPNNMRYKTEEITLLDNRIQRAEYEIKEYEERIFNDLVSSILQYSSEIRTAANLLAVIDVNSSLSVVARLYSYCKPIITSDYEIDIKNGRHPVVETVQQAKQQSGEFTPNDTQMDINNRVFLLTGPNMGGKSTYLRQIAIHAILAQSGSYIPALSAKIGVFDRIFSRVGAADDVKNDQSTFMMEMQEAATILNMATSKSLVIVDELGRGTSTLEGLSIAWAVLEYLHNINKSRTIFATHYHELAQLKTSLPAMNCLQMQIMENKESSIIAFLHKVIQGVADKSYGVHVAKLAGIPKQVTTRAENILQQLITKDQISLNTFQEKDTNDNILFPIQSNLPIECREYNNSYYLKVDKNPENIVKAFEIISELLSNNKE